MQGLNRSGLRKLAPKSHRAARTRIFEYYPSPMRTPAPIARTVFALAFASLCVASRAETVLIDFGTNVSFRGVSAASPDTNGNHWNVFKPGDYLANMVNTGGNATTIDIGLDPTGSTVATDSYNGPAGATSNPVTAGEVTATDIDATALGSLGIKEAGIDFISSATGRFQIQGLDPAKTYRLQLFASHKFSANPTTVFTIYTDSTYATAVASADVNVQNVTSPWLHNRDTLATFRNLVPQTSNILYVQFNGLGGTGSGYLNALRITTEIPAPTNPAATGATGAVNLSWSASSGATHYSVSRAEATGGPYAVLAATVTGTTYSDTTATPGQTYYYIVTASDAEIASANSSEVSASALSPILAPVSLSATGVSGAVNLTWNTSVGATYYSVLRSTTPGGAYSTLATPLAGTTHSDTSASPGQTYYYVVTASDASNTSVNSTEVSAAALPVLSLIETWRAAKFGTSSNTGSAADNEDPDGDGLVNFMEYALAGEPLQAGSSPRPAVSSGSPLTIEFTRIADPSLTYTVEATSDLVAGPWVSIWSTTGAGNTAGPVTVSDPGPVTGNKRFLRLSVSIQ